MSDENENIKNQNQTENITPPSENSVSQNQPQINKETNPGSSTQTPEINKKSFSCALELFIKSISLTKQNWKLLFVFLGLLLIKIIFSSFAFLNLLMSIFIPIFMVGQLALKRDFENSKILNFNELFVALKSPKSADFFILGILQYLGGMFFMIFFGIVFILQFLFLNRDSVMTNFVDLLKSVMELNFLNKGVNESLELMNIVDSFMQVPPILHLVVYLLTGVFAVTILILFYSAFVFSPFLIFDFNTPIKQALKLSMAACLKNLGFWLGVFVCFILTILVSTLTLGILYLITLPLLNYYFLKIYEALFLKGQE